MSTRRMFGVSGLSMIVPALVFLVAGCGEAGGPANTAGPNQEVKIVEPVDAQGKTISTSEETATPPKAK